MEVVLDFETFSRADLRKTGADRYARDPSTDVICLSWAVDDMPPATWAPSLGKAIPAGLLDAIKSGAILIAHNAGFEQAIWHYVMVAKYKWPEMPTERWHCTMAGSLLKALPGKLEHAAEALGLKHKKDMAGNRLLGQVSKPNKKTGLFNDDMFKMQQVMDYCAQDVRVERELHRRTGVLPPEERQVWLLDQQINQRGVKFDIPFVKNAIEVVAQVEKSLTAELSSVTGGTVESHNQIEAMLDFIKVPGMERLPDLTSDTVERALDMDIDPKTRRVLEIRQILAKAGTKKLKAILACVGSDDRARGLLQYHGATPGRWSGRLVQPQNFQRPDEEFEKLDIEDLVTAINTSDAEFCDMLYGDAMAVVANAMRGTIIAEADKELVAGDFSSVEARILVCLSGDTWKVDAFRDPKFDPYCAFAKTIYGHEVTKKEHPAKRTNGKIGELAFGYQGGLGAWRGFEDYKTTKKYGQRTDEEVNGFKNVWRELHPGVKGLWHGLENAAVAAVARREPYSYRGITYRLNGDWLNCVLPSGRLLWYHNPRVVETTVPWSDEPRLQLQYDMYRYGQWRTIHSYGGMLTENVVQATARDLMVPAMFKAERAGMPIVLTVHDEIVCEVLGGSGDPKVLEEIMRDVPPWAKGWPINAEAWVGPRYHK